MRSAESIEMQEYVKVSYDNFNASRLLTFFRKLFGYLILPLLYPLILLSKTSDFIFRTVAEFLALIPFMFGIIMREAFYKRTLDACGDNLSINFGTYFVFRNISIGDHVLIGSNCSINHCDFGSNVLVGPGCRLLSGSRQHEFERMDIPMTMQKGWMKKIKISNDVWIGANSVIMDDIEDGSIIGAGSVVNKKVEKFSICAGNPARIIGTRK